MADLFQPPGTRRRPFGGIVNPFEAPTPAPPPQPARPPQSPNAWRTAFGPNPFNQALQPGPAPPAVQPIWGFPDYQPRGPARDRPYREDAPYFNFQHRAFRNPAAPAAVPLGPNGAAGTAPEPIAPLLLVLAASVRGAASAALASCAALLGMACDLALFLWRVALPALLRLLAALLWVLAALLWALARCAVYGFVVWWLGAVLARLSAFSFRWATGTALGWSWKTPAKAYRLRREYTTWSASSARAAGVVAPAPGSGASLRTDLSTNLVSYDTGVSERTAVLTEQCPLDNSDLLLKTWNISFVWNVSITTVTAILWNNFIEPFERDDL